MGGVRENALPSRVGIQQTENRISLLATGEPATPISAQLPESDI